jgi:hypothetical protein
MMLHAANPLQNVACRLTKDLHFEMHILPIMRMIHAKELKIDLLGCKL